MTSTIALRDVRKKTTSIEILFKNMRENKEINVRSGTSAKISRSQFTQRKSSIRLLHAMSVLQERKKHTDLELCNNLV